MDKITARYIGIYRKELNYMADRRTILEIIETESGKLYVYKGANHTFKYVERDEIVAIP